MDQPPDAFDEPPARPEPSYFQRHRSHFLIVAAWFATAQIVYMPNQSRFLPCDFNPATDCVKLTGESFRGKRLVFNDPASGATSVTEDFTTAVPNGCVIVNGTVYRQWPVPMCEVPWSPIDTLYFSAQSLVTVGYGDFVPTTPGLKMFTIVYVMFGLLVVGSIVGQHVTDAITRQQRKFLGARGVSQDNGIDEDPGKGASWWDHSNEIVIMLLMTCTLLLTGAITFCILEDWSMIDSIFFVWSTSVMLGYGDKIPDKEMSRLVCTVYLVISTFALSTFLSQLSTIASTVARKRKAKEDMHALMNGIG